MEKINLNLDSKRFPQIYMRYSPDKMRDLLIKMCQGLKIEITEANLYAMAANVERDLRHLSRVPHSPLPRVVPRSDTALCN